MRKLWSVLPFRCFLLLAIFPMTLLQPVFAQEGSRRALLIGINDYANLPKLKGSLNDVATVRDLLVTRYGFPEENIREVTDAQATREGILSALEKIVKQSGPDDIVYLHYSGHGSQVKDLNGDEKDGMDETICPQDARSSGTRDITDDELDNIISGFRTKSVMMVMDSCHAGTGLRDALLDVRQRSVPPDERTELYAAAQKKVKTRAVVPLPTSERYLLFTGAADYQSALDGPFANGRYHGLFTYCFSNALAELPKGATATEVMVGVGQQIDKLRSRLGGFPPPEPQLEAPQEYLDRPLLTAATETAQEKNSEITARLPWVHVQQDDLGNIVLLGGVDLGAQPGSIWAIYPPDETNFPPGAAFATVEIDRLEGDDAVARLVGSDYAVPPTGSRAVLLQPAPVTEQLSLLLRKVDEPLRGKLENDLLRMFGDIVLFVQPGDIAAAVLDCEPYADESMWRCMLEGVGNGVTPLELIASEDKMAGEVAVHLWRPVLVALLQSTENVASQMELDVKVHGDAARTPVPIGSRGVKVTVNTAPSALRFYTLGQPRTSQNSLQLEVEANRDCYLTIVEIDSEGKLGQLFPNVLQKPEFYPEGRISAGEKVLIPDSFQSGNRAGFNFDYGPPAGTDTVQAFCMEDSVDAELLRSKLATVAREPAGLAASTTRSAVSKLRHDLAKTAVREGRPSNAGQSTGTTSRGTGAQSDWTASSLTLEVSE